jgi:hypothetical protein
MNILRLEFYPSEPGSYNDLIAQLIKKVRYFTTQIPADEIQLHIPDARRLESKIQYLDKQMGEVPKDYLAEIMNALNIESEIENQLREELAWTLKSITPGIIGEEIKLEDIDFDYMEQQNTYWVEFNGFNKPGLDKKNMQTIKEIMMSVCIKAGVVFLDCED